MSQGQFDKVVDVRTVAKELLQQYGSRKEISHHSKELIEKYGQVVYSQIIRSVKRYRQQEAREEEPIKHGEYQIRVREIIRAERDRISSRYHKGGRYAFVITKKRFSPELSTVRDKYGEKHYVALPNRFVEGDKISCIVRDYNVRMNKKNGTKAKSVLTLEIPRKLPDKTEIDLFEPIPAKHYVISPHKIAGLVEGYGKHICGKPFVCTCCGERFPARKGYRIELKEVYLCMDCKREVFPPSGKGWRGRIISTPMGNKR